MKISYNNNTKQERKVNQKRSSHKITTTSQPAKKPIQPFKHPKQQTQSDSAGHQRNFVWRTELHLNVRAVEFFS